jgi:hypothetical protein
MTMMMTSLSQTSAWCGVWLSIWSKFIVKFVNRNDKRKYIILECEERYRVIFLEIPTNHLPPGVTLLPLLPESKQFFKTVLSKYS